MRPETEGKIMVALIISLIAFGCGSGVGIVIGISQNDTSSPFSLNYTQQNPQLPTSNISYTEPAKTTTSQDNQDSEEVYVESNNNNQKNKQNYEKNENDDNSDNSTGNSNFNENNDSY
ncbi:hypothetical protein [Methanobacterium alcaliphilum]|uniref:hypothetical protein n=1 Tax=Methanobacterium alcaliphilum TaxID=392018 RepID=UPI002009F5D2|nr:hypothetical protein [Methanobacterium alcaliphilum]MCK9151625.1 hypothetical protein [Methanobacterium alcaliphilum]